MAFSLFFPLSPSYGLKDSDKRSAVRVPDAPQRVMLLAKPEKINSVLASRDFRTRVGVNFPAALVYGSIFLEAAGRQLGDEDVRQLGADLKLTPTDTDRFYKLLSEAKINADVLLLDANPPALEAVRAELTEHNLAPFLLKNSQVDSDLICLLAIASSLYRFPEKKIAALSKALGVHPESFYSQIGIAARFLDSVGSMRFPKAMGLTESEILAPLGAFPASSDASPLPAEAAPAATSSADDEAHSREILDSVKKTVAKINSRILGLDHTSVSAVEEMIVYLDKKIKSISARLDLITNSGQSPAVEAERQHGLEIVTGLMNKQKELAVEFKNLKKKSPAAPAAAPAAQPSTDEALIDAARETKEDLVLAIRNLDRRDREAMAALIERLEKQARLMEKAASKAAPKTQNVVKAAAAELMYEARRLSDEIGSLGAQPEPAAPKEDQGRQQTLLAKIRAQVQALSRKLDQPPAEAGAAGKMLAEARAEFDRIRQMFSGFSEKISDEGVRREWTELEKSLAQTDLRIGRLEEDLKKASSAEAKKADEEKSLRAQAEKTFLSLESRLAKVQARTAAELEALLSGMSADFEFLAQNRDLLPAGRDLARLDQSRQVLEKRLAEMRLAETQASEDLTASQQLLEQAREIERDLLQHFSRQENSASEDVRRLTGLLSEYSEKLEKQAQSLTNRSASDQVEANRQAILAIAVSLNTQREKLSSSAEQQARRLEEEAQASALLERVRLEFEQWNSVVPQVEQEDTDKVRAYLEQKRAVPQKFRQELSKLANSGRSPEIEVMKKNIQKTLDGFQGLETRLERALEAGTSRSKAADAAGEALLAEMGEFRERFERFVTNAAAGNSRALNDALSDLDLNIEKFQAKQRKLPQVDPRTAQSVAQALSGLETRRQALAEERRQLLLSESEARQARQVLEQVNRKMAQIERQLSSVPADPAALKQLIQSAELVAGGFDESASGLPEGAASPEVKSARQDILNMSRRLKERAAEMSREAAAGEEKLAAEEQSARDALSEITARRQQLEEGAALARQASASEDSVAGLEKRIIAIQTFRKEIGQKIAELSKSSATPEIDSVKQRLLKTAGELGDEAAGLKQLKEKMSAEIQGARQAGLAREQAKAQAVYDDLQKEITRLGFALANQTNPDSAQLASWLEDLRQKKKSFNDAYGQLPPQGQDPGIDTVLGKISAMLARLDEMEKDLLTRLKNVRSGEIAREKETAQAQALLEQIQAEIADWESVVSKLDTYGAKQLESLAGNLRAKKERLAAGVRQMPDDAASPQLKNLRDQAAAGLARMEALESSIIADLDGLRQKQAAQSQEEAAAQALYGKISADAAQWQSMVSDLGGRDAEQLKSFLANLQAEKKSFEAESRNLANTSNSPAVKDLRDKIGVSLGALAETEAQLRAELQTFENKASLKEKEETLAEETYERLLAKFTETESEMGNLEHYGTRELKSLAANLAQQIEEFAGETSRLQNTSGAPAVETARKRISGLSSQLDSWAEQVEEKIEALSAAEQSLKADEDRASGLYDAAREMSAKWQAVLARLEETDAAQISSWKGALSAEIAELERRAGALPESGASEKIEDARSKIAGMLEQLRAGLAGLDQRLAVLESEESARNEEETSARNLNREAEAEAGRWEKSAGQLSQYDDAKLESLKEQIEKSRSALSAAAQQTSNKANSAVTAGLQQKTADALARIESSEAKINEALEARRQQAVRESEARRISEKQAADREKGRQAADTAAQTLLEKVSAESARLEKLFSSTSPRDVKALEKLLSEVERSRSSSQAEAERFSDTGSVMGAMGDRISSLIEGLKSLEAQIAERVQTLKARESRQKKEEDSARAVYEKASQDLSRLEGAAKALAKMQRTDLEPLTGELKSARAALEEESRRLTNTTGSEFVNSIQEKLAAALNRFTALEGQAGERLRNLREQELRRSEEEDTARALYDRAAAESARWESLLAKADNFGAERLRALDEELQSRHAEMVTAFNALSNVSGSREISALQEKTSSLIEQLAVFDARIKDRFQSLETREAERVREEESVQALLRKVTKESIRFENLLTRADARDGAALEKLLSELRSAQASLLEEIKAVSNVSGSPLVVSLEEKLSSMIEGMSSFDAQISERIRALKVREERQKKEEDNAAALAAPVEKEMARLEPLAAELQGKSRQELETLRDDLKTKRSSYLDEFKRLTNTTDSELVTATQQRLTKAFVRMAEIETQMTEALRAFREKEAREREEEETAQAFFDRVGQETGRLEKLMAGAGQQNMSELEGLLKTVRLKRTRFAQQFNELPNTTASPRVSAIVENASALLEKLAAFDGRIEEQFKALEAREAARLDEEAAAQALLEKVSRLSLQIENRISAADPKDDQALAKLLEDLRQSRAAGLEEVKALQNSAQSPLVASLQEKISSLLEGMASFDTQVSERLRALQVRESRRLEEERAAAGLHDRLMADMAPLGQSMSGLESQNREGLETLLDALRSSRSGYMDAYRQLTNTTDSDIVTAIQEKITAELQQMAQWEATAGERLRAVREREAKQSDEEENARFFFGQLDQETTRLEALLASVDRQGSAELESLLKTIRLKRTKLAGQFNELPNTTGSAEISELQEKSAALLEKIAAFDAQVAERFRSVQAREAAQRDEEGAAQGLLDAVTADSARFEGLIAQVNTKDASALESLLGSLSETRAAHEERFKQLANTSGSTLVTSLQEKLSSLLEGLASFENQVSENLRAVKVRLARRKKEEKAAVSLYKEIARETERADAASGGLEAQRREELESLLQELQERRAGFLDEFRKLTNTTDSEVVTSSQEKMSALFTRLSQTETRVEEQLAAVRAWEAKQNEEESAAREVLSRVQAESERQEAYISGIDNQTPGELENFLDKSRALRQEFSETSKQLQNTTQSAEVAAVQEKLAGLLENFVGYDVRIAEQLEKARAREQKRKDEEAAAQELLDRVNADNSRLEARVAEVDSRDGEALRTLLQELRSSKAAAVQKLNQFGNEAQSPLVDSLKERVSDLLQSLTGLDAQVAEKLRALKMRQARQKQEEDNAAALRGQVSQALSETEEILGRLDSESRGDLEAFRQKVRDGLEAFADAARQLTNTTDSSVVRGNADEITAMLSKIQDGDARLAAKIDELRELEARREAEEQSARALAGAVQSADEGFAARSSQIEASGREDLEPFKREIEARRAEFAAQAAQLANTAGSGLVPAIQEKLSVQLSAWEELAGRIDARLNEIAEFEARRAQEEAAAQTVLEQAQAEVSRFEQPLSTIESLSPEALESLRQEIESGRSSVIEALEGLSDSTQSSETASRRQTASQLAASLQNSARRVAGQAKSAARVRKAAETLAGSLRAEAAGLADRMAAAETAPVGDLRDLSGAIQQMLENYQPQVQSMQEAYVSDVREELNAVLAELSRGREQVEGRIELLTRQAEEESLAAKEADGARQAAAATREKLETLVPTDPAALETMIRELKGISDALTKQSQQISNTTHSAAVDADRAAIEDLARDFQEKQGTLTRELADLRLKDKEEARSMESLFKEVQRFYKRTSKDMGRVKNVPDALSAKAGEADRLTADYEARVSAAPNTAGNPQTERLKNEAGRMIDALKQGSAALRQRAGEIVRAGEEAEAQAFLRRLEEESARWQSLLSVLEDRSVREIETALEELKDRRASFSGEARQIKNTTASSEVEARQQEAGRILESLSALETDISGILDKVRARDRRQAQALADGIAAEVGANADRLSAIENETIDTLKTWAEAIRTSAGAYREKVSALGEEHVRDIRSLAEEKLQQLDNQEATAAARLEELVRLREETRQAEETAARNLLEKAALENDRLQSLVSGQPELDLGGLRALAKELQGARAGLNREVPLLSNTLDSPLIREVLEKLSALSDQRSQWVKQVRERASLVEESRGQVAALIDEIKGIEAAAAQKAASLQSVSAEDLQQISDELKNGVELFLPRVNALDAPYLSDLRSQGLEILGRLETQQKEISARIEFVNRQKEEESEWEKLAEEGAQASELLRGKLERVSRTSPVDLRQAVSDLQTMAADLARRAEALPDATSSVKVASQKEVLNGFVRDFTGKADELSAELERLEAKVREETETAAAWMEKTVQAFGELKQAAGGEDNLQAVQSLAREWDDFAGGLERQLRNLANTAQDPAIEKIRSEAGALLSQAEASAEALQSRAADLVRQQEEAAAEKLLEEVRREESRVETVLPVLTRQTSSDLEQVIRELQRRRADFLDTFKALNNTSASPRVTALQDEIAGILRSLGKVDQEMVGQLTAVRAQENSEREQAESLLDEMRRLKETLAPAVEAIEEQPLDNLRRLAAEAGESLGGYGSRAEKLEADHLGDIRTEVKLVLAELVKQQETLVSRAAFLEKRQQEEKQSRQFVNEVKRAAESMRAKMEQVSKTDIPAVAAMTEELAEVAADIRAKAEAIPNTTSSAGVETSRKLLEDLAQEFLTQSETLKSELESLRSREKSELESAQTLLKETERAQAGLAAGLAEVENESQRIESAAQEFSELAEKTADSGRRLSNTTANAEIEKARGEVLRASEDMANRAQALRERAQSLLLLENARNEYDSLQGLISAVPGSDMKALENLITKVTQTEARLEEGAEKAANSQNDPDVERNLEAIRQQSAEFGRISAMLTKQLNGMKELRDREAADAETFLNEVQSLNAKMRDDIAAAQTAADKYELASRLETFIENFQRKFEAIPNSFNDRTLEVQKEKAGRLLKDMSARIKDLAEETARQEELDAQTLLSYAESRLIQFKEQADRLPENDKERLSTFISDVYGETKEIKRRAREISNHSRNETISASLSRIEEILQEMQDLSGRKKEVLERVQKTEIAEIQGSSAALEQARKAVKEIESGLSGLDRSSLGAYDRMTEKIRAFKQSVSADAENVPNTLNSHLVEKNRGSLRDLAATFDADLKKLTMEREMLQEKLEEEYRAFELLNEARAELTKLEEISPSSVAGAAAAEERMIRIGQTRDDFSKKEKALVNTGGSDLVETNREKLRLVLQKMDALSQGFSSRLQELRRLEKTELNESQVVLEKAQSLEMALTKETASVGPDDIPALEAAAERLAAQSAETLQWARSLSNQTNSGEVEKNRDALIKIASALREESDKFAAARTAAAGCREDEAAGLELLDAVNAESQKLFASVQDVFASEEPFVPAFEDLLAQWNPTVEGLQSAAAGLPNRFQSAQADANREKIAGILAAMRGKLDEIAGTLTRLKTSRDKETADAALILKQVRQKQEALFQTLTATDEYEQLQTLLPEISALAAESQAAAQQLQNVSREPSVEEDRHALQAISDELTVLQESKRMQLLVRKREQEETASQQVLARARAERDRLKREWQGTTSTVFKFWSDLADRIQAAKKELQTQYGGIENQSKSLEVEMNRNEILGLMNEFDAMRKACLLKLSKLREKRTVDAQEGEAVRAHAAQVKEGLASETLVVDRQDLDALDSLILRLNAQADEFRRWAEALPNSTQSRKVVRSQREINRLAEELKGLAAELDIQRQALADKLKQEQMAQGLLDRVRAEVARVKNAMPEIDTLDKEGVQSRKDALQARARNFVAETRLLPGQTSNPKVQQCVTEINYLLGQLEEADEKLGQAKTQIDQKDRDFRESQRLLKAAEDKVEYWRGRLGHLGSVTPAILYTVFKDLEEDSRLILEQGRAMANPTGDPRIEEARKRVKALAGQISGFAKFVYEEKERLDKKSEEESYSKALRELTGSEVTAIRERLDKGYFKDTESLEALIRQIQNRKNIFRQRLETLPNTSGSGVVEKDRSEIINQLTEMDRLESRAIAQMRDFNAPAAPDVSGRETLEEVEARRKTAVDALKKSDSQGPEDLKKLINLAETNMKDVTKLEEAMPKTEDKAVLAGGRQEIGDILGETRSLLEKAEKEKQKQMSAEKEEAIGRDILTFGEKATREFLDKTSSLSDADLKELEELRDQAKGITQILYNRLQELPQIPTTTKSQQNVDKIMALIKDLLRRRETLAEKMNSYKRVEGPELMDSVRTVERAKRVEKDFMKQIQQVNGQDPVVLEAMTTALKSQVNSLKSEARMISNQTGNPQIEAQRKELDRIADRLDEQANRLGEKRGPAVLTKKEAEEQAQFALRDVEKEVGELRVMLRSIDQENPQALFEAISVIRTKTQNVNSELRQIPSNINSKLIANKAAVETMIHELADQTTQLTLKLIAIRTQAGTPATGNEKLDQDVKESFEALRKAQRIIEDISGKLKLYDTSNAESSKRLATLLASQAREIENKALVLSKKQPAEEIGKNIQVLRLIAQDITEKAKELQKQSSREAY